MTDTADSAPNAAQVEYWNTVTGPTWAEMQAPLDRQLAPLGRLAMAAASTRTGPLVSRTMRDLPGANSP